MLGPSSQYRDLPGSFRGHDDIGLSRKPLPRSLRWCGSGEGGVQARTLAHFCTHHTVWPTLGTTTEAGPSLNSQNLFSKAGFNPLHILPLVSPSFLSLQLLSQLTDKGRLSHIRTNLPRTLCPSGLWFSALGAPEALHLAALN